MHTPPPEVDPDFCPADTDVLPDETEAFRELVALAGRRTRPIPADLLARHILAVTDGGDWPVQREAMEALIRRHQGGRSDSLVIARRPPERAVFGLYITRRRGASTRPYRTILEQLDPPAGSCDCPDFLRSSLGLCKHLLAVIEDICRKPRRFRQGLRDASPLADKTRLAWQPLRPLTGIGDPLDQIRWLRGGTPDFGTGADPAVRRYFCACGNGDLKLRKTFADQPGHRLDMVEDLRRKDGGVHIEAPPEAAASLGALFEGMARLMKEASGK